MPNLRHSFSDYSTVEPYLDENGQQCIFAYDVGTPCWQNFTGENFHEPVCKKDVPAWNKIFDDAKLWRLPGDLNFPEGIPKPDDLKEIHRCLVSFINSHVWFRDKKASIVLANWIILSYFRDKFDFIPLIIINGTTNSGKSTLGEVLMAACYRGTTLSNFTASTIVQRINEFHTSVFLDKPLNAFNKKDRINILDILKYCSDSKPYFQIKPHTPYGGVDAYLKTSVAISINGEIPESIASRGILIQMFPKPNDVKLESFNINDDEPIDGFYTLREIRARLTALKISMDLRDVDPTNYIPTGRILSTRELHRGSTTICTLTETLTVGTLLKLAKSLTHSRPWE